jgi:O-antigen ligase
MVTYYWAATGFSSKSALIILLIALAAIGVFIALDLQTMSYEGLARGETTDTRTAAWARMWAGIVETPFFGLGHFPEDASENSYLRAWASYGIFYFLGLVFVSFFAITSLVSSTKNASKTRPFLFLSLSVALVVGGVFEGYLVDAFSFPLICWLFLCVTAGEHPIAPLTLRSSSLVKAGGHRRR